MIKVTFGLKSRNIQKEEADMIYACKQCGFLYQRSGVEKECPFCKGGNTRPATYKEFQSMKALLVSENAFGKEARDHGRKTLTYRVMGA